MRTTLLGLTLTAALLGTPLGAQRSDSAKPADSDVEVLPVQGNVSAIFTGTTNVVVQVGPLGAVLVDTGAPAVTERILAEVARLTDQSVRLIINTSVDRDHIGGNEAIAKAGRFRAGGNVVGDLGAAATATAAVIAHENVLKRLSAEPAQGQTQVAFALWPTETFITKRREFLFNGEAVQIIHEPNAHTDGDSVVFFRRSDVVATGDLFTTVMYPYIDVANGGTIDGYIKALNAIMDITVASNVNEGGTMVIPGHGRVSDEQDVVEYRNMTTIIRDRIKEYVKRGMTLEQVKAAKPTLDYDPRYGSDTGFWTTAMFVETIYKQMVEANPPAKPSQNRNQNRNQQNQQKGKSE